MKRQNHRSLLAILASALLSALASPPARADTVLLDPDQPLIYPIAAWSPLNKVQTARLESLSFEGPADGGGGIVLASPLDLSTDRYLVANIKIRSGHTAESVRLVLISADKGGTEWILPIPAGGKAGDSLVFAGRLDRGQLAHDVSARADLKAIIQFQFIGSFNKSHRVALDVEVVKTTNTAPEDALAAR